MRLRQAAPVALVVALTVVGFIAARMLAQRDVRRDADRRAEVAAAQIHSRMAQAASLTESLRRFMLDAGGTGVTSDQFARTSARWLSPASFQAAAWVERVPAEGRAAYERRLGQPIVTPDVAHSVVPAGARSSYAAATLVSGFPPLALPGIDLSRERGMAAALDRSTRLDRVIATQLSGAGTGTNGFFLVAPAPNLVAGTLRQGHVVVFVPEDTLRSNAASARSVQIAAGAPANAPSQAAHRRFSAAGQRFDVVVPRGSAHGAGTLLPWFVLAGGLVLAAAAAALGVIAARRARAKEELDRIFTLSPDLIAVADFDGYFTRVNPAASEILGYTREELLERPYLDLVHPEDREQTAAEAVAISEGKTTLSFENRYVRKDGSERVLEWTTTPVVDDRIMYGMARDVTARRQADREEAALRRIATLAAEGVKPEELFAVVAEEVARVVDVALVRVMRYERDGTATSVGNFSADGEHVPFGDRSSLEGTSVLRFVRETSKPARVDDYSELEGEIAEIARNEGIRSAAGSPILVAGRLWGAVVASSREVLPRDTEQRLADFTELLASAIGNAESRQALERLAGEQAALRRVATLVAQGAQPAEIFSAVTDEAGRVLGSEAAAVVRFDQDDPGIVFVGVSKRIETLPSGPALPHRWDVADDSLAVAEVFRSGHSARVEARDWSALTGPIAEVARGIGVVSSVACPIVVEGRPWGAVSVSSTDEPLPSDTEGRLENFTELAATAIANAESRGALRRVVDEQATLRRIATLVAEGVQPATIFSAVTDDVAGIFGCSAAVTRFEEDGAAVDFVGVSGVEIAAGTRWELEEGMASAEVYRSGRSARLDAVAGSPASRTLSAELESLGMVSSVASPIVVEGRLWGTLNIATGDGILPLDSEQRLERFTELVATAIANAESREALSELADEQAALRRLATLIAEGVSPAEIFFVVSQEIQLLFGAEVGTVGRFDPGPEFVFVGVGEHVEGIPLGSRWDANDLYVSTRVFRTGRSARVDAGDLDAAGGPVAEDLRRQGHVCQLASPIVVEGKLWGAVTLTSNETLPFDTERRLEKFAELIGTAIANAESKSELTASRRRIVTASDEARRQIERDLHDGTQQRLVSLGLAVRAARASVPPDHEDLREELSAIASDLGDALTDLQELSRGIHSAILSRGGLEPALRTLARRAAIPVTIDVELDERLPRPIESAAYFVASEALANATKHARASRIEVSLTSQNGSLLMCVRDDGVGGVDPTRGSGVVGLTDRVEALGGSIHVRSQTGEGTEITAELPLELEEVR
jgi:PAS domain S-box-containing protein